MQPYTYRRLLYLAWPLVLGTAANSAMLFTDRMFLSHVGSAALAASFPAGVIGYLLASLFVASAGYTATFVAQHIGAGEPHECGPSTWQGLWVAAAAGMCNGCIIPWLPSVFAWMHPAPDVLHALNVLGPWFCANAPAVTVIAALSGHFAGTGRTRVVLAMNTSLLILNAALNGVLIFGYFGCPALGVAGSGIGTFAATTCIASIALLLFIRPHENATYRTWPATWQARRLMTFGRLAVPQGARQVIDLLAWTCFAFAVGRFGTLALAANNIVITWNLLTFIPMVGFSQAIAVAVGTSIGASDVTGAAVAARRGVILTLSYGVLLSLVYLAASPWMIDLFLNVPMTPEADVETRDTARSLMVVAALWNIGDAMQMSYSGALAGAGDTRWPFLVSLVTATTLLMVPMAVMVHLSERTWTHPAVRPVVLAWMLTLIYVSATGVILALRWRSGHWRGLTVRSMA